MTRSVRIQESGVSQDFSDVKTVTTPVVGGGNATWMPEDETAVGEITITGNGEFVPSEHDLYGFHKVNVMVPGGGQGEYVSPGGIGVNIDGTIPMTQPDGTISNVRIGDGPYTPPPAGIGGTIDGVSVSGGTIAGIDPDTGDYVQYTVVDSGGTPTLSKTTPQEPVPTSISIINPPNQTTYKPGALIKFAGLKMGVYDQNGKPFTAAAFTPSSGHTFGPYDGTIPFSELVFPVKYVQGESGDDDEYTDGHGINALLINTGEVHYFSPSAWYPYGAYGSSKVLGTYSGGQQDGHRWTIGKDENDPSCEMYVTIFYVNSKPALYAKRKSGSQSGVVTVDIDGKSRSWWSAFRLSGNWKLVNLDVSNENPSIPISTINPVGHDTDLFPKATYIPVGWVSPYDNVAREDMFEIKIVDSTNDGYSGSGGGSF